MLIILFIYNLFRYIFGGRNGEQDNVGRNDFWSLEIDTDEIKTFNYDSDTQLNQGKNIYTYIESSPNYTENYCLSSINVTITINHPCVEELDIFLVKIANYTLDGAGLKRLRLWRANNNGVCHNFTVYYILYIVLYLNRKLLLVIMALMLVY